MIVTHLYTDHIFEATASVPWKLNMTATSSRLPYFILALRRQVHVYSIEHYTRRPVFRAKLQYPGTSQVDEINSIAVGILGGEEAIIAVYHSGLTAAWRLSGEFPVIWNRRGESSTWGCAIHGPSDTVATSANSRKIDILRPLLRQSYDGSESTFLPENRGGDAIRVPDFQGSVVQLVGHGNNIPSVALSACGRYVASASIDRTIRLWSLHDQSNVFTWQHHQWCWAVQFVYPFYFSPDNLTQADSNRGLIEVDRASSEHGGNLDHIASQVSTPDTDDSEGPTGLMDIAAELVVAVEVASATESNDNPVSDMEREAIDHSADMENGHERDPTSTSSNKSGDADSGVDEIGPKNSVATSMLPSMVSPLLLCGTERDILLLDPVNSAAPVVSSIVRAASRNALPVYAEMAFDRLTFLEWVPELSIVVAGSFSGTVALIYLQISSNPQQTNKYAMQLFAHLPAETTDKQLYGVVVYRHTLDIEQFKAVTLILTFIDGTIMAYELRNSPDNANVL